MHNKTLTEIRADLASGAYSSVEVTQYFLNRIHNLDSKYNSFISICDDYALKQAKQADEKIATKQAGAFTGLPIAHKDIFCTQDILTTCGSKMLHNFISPYDATLVEKYKQAGAVMLGKTNMDEFAMGSSNETSYYGKVRNPWNTDCVPGGSSGGSAAAVAARLIPAATATDTGGSIRQPAALCGITGLKPTYGRVSRFGMIAFASSLDQAGTMTQTAEDTALMLNYMAGFDPKDSTSVDEPVEDYSQNLNQPLKGLRIGLPVEYFPDSLDSQMKQKIMDGVKEYEKLGAQIVDIHLPNTALSVPVYYVIAPAECSANLSRFDGVRFGHRCKNPTSIDDLYMRSRAEGFGDEVKRRIMMGTYVLSAGFYDAYYKKAQQVRRLIKQDFVEAFKNVDVILSPTSPTPAFKFDSKGDDPIAMYLEDIFTIATNLAGLPGMSIPCGQIQGLPVGMQLIGNYFSESRLLNVAHMFQQATDWHKQTPADI